MYYKKQALTKKAKKGHEMNLRLRTKQLKPMIYRDWFR